MDSGQGVIFFKKKKTYLGHSVTLRASCKMSMVRVTLVSQISFNFSLKWIKLGQETVQFFLFNVGKDYKRLKYSMISEKEKSCAGYKNIKSYTNTINQVKYYVCKDSARM